MRPLYKSIPNLLTLTNGLFGVLSILAYLTLSLRMALACLAVSLVADLLDGMVARLLHASSEIGADLDSLSDVISFGAAPAVLLAMTLHEQGWHLAWAALLVVPASIYRLAKFNNDTRQSDSFLGLATTGNAMLIAPLALLLERHPMTPTPLAETLLLLGMILDAWLLVCEVPFFGMKQIARGWRANVRLIVVAVAAVALVLLRGVEGLFWAMALYIAINLLTWLTHRSSHTIK